MAAPSIPISIKDKVSKNLNLHVYRDNSNSLTLSNVGKLS